MRPAPLVAALILVLLAPPGAACTFPPQYTTTNRLTVWHPDTDDAWSVQVAHAAPGLCVPTDKADFDGVTLAWSEAGDLFRRTRSDASSTRLYDADVTGYDWSIDRDRFRYDVRPERILRERNLTSNATTDLFAYGEGESVALHGHMALVRHAGNAYSLYDGQARAWRFENRTAASFEVAADALMSAFGDSYVIFTRYEYGIAVEYAHNRRVDIFAATGRGGGYLDESDLYLFEAPDLLRHSIPDNVTVKLGPLAGGYVAPSGVRHGWVILNNLVHGSSSTTSRPAQMPEGTALSPTDGDPPAPRGLPHAAPWMLVAAAAVAAALTGRRR